MNRILCSYGRGEEKEKYHHKTVEQNNISERSRRVAKNTVFLYFRMLLLVFIGLFTSRIVLNSLGVDDYGTYQVVYSAVMMFTVFSNSIGTSISRFMAYELGAGDSVRIRKVFSSAIIIQLALSTLLVVIAETLGLWYLTNRIDIPAGRESAAMWVFQLSIVHLIIQLMSLPYNCAITAHEDMKAFAWVSILEGILRLGIALALFLTSYDRLKVYAVLMVVVTLIVRGAYSIFCKKHYPETRGRLEIDINTIKPMLSLGTWSFTAYGVGVFNTQGVSLLLNSFFGVAINAARGIAGQAESIVRQFVSSFLSALNPLITKTWAEGNKDYCFALVRKGCKFGYLIVLLFAMPFLFESEFIFRLWLGKVPEGASLFATLAIICVMADFMSNSLGQLMYSYGKVGKYYIATSSISALTFLGSWFALSRGAAAEITYLISIAVFTAIAIVRLLFVKADCGFELKPFIKESVMPAIFTSLISLIITYIPYHFIPSDGPFKSVACIIISMVSVVLAAYATALTEGERDYCKNAIARIFHK